MLSSPSCSPLLHLNFQINSPSTSAMEPHVFDFIKIEKENAISRFNCFRRIAKLRQLFEVFVVLGLISWSSARVPPLLRSAAAYAVEFSTYLFNHHVVFLIGNAIIVMLFLLCRQNGAAAPLSGGGDDFYDEYVKHSDAAADRREFTDLHPPSPIPSAAFNSPTNCGEEEKQIVVCAEEIVTATPQSDDMTAAIEKARKQIKRFERTQSEKLKRKIRATPRPELRRSETQNRRNSVSCAERFEAAEIERLSSEEFRRTIDAFIDENWSTRKNKRNQFEEYQKYQLMKMAY